MIFFKDGLHMKNEKIERIHYLIDTLQKASKAYYALDAEIMSNFEYDKLYDELESLEQETGIVLANSPTQTVGFEAVQELPKERHEKPMLSLGKTKDREELKEWLKDKTALLSWKLDGLTIVLTYQDGKLVKAVTRGNGEVGEVVTNNARMFKNLPLTIPYQGELILRGEAVIRYSDFEKMNAQIPEEENKYKNPRNLCSGSVRQLDNKITADRNVRLYAFSLVKAEGIDFNNSREQQFLFLKQLGFSVVEYCVTDAEKILADISQFEEDIKEYDIPSDGLVLALDDLAYGQSLGMTAKFPRDSIAFKWADEIKETHLIKIEWSPSRTGLINPVAVFEPVELEGTTVSRASVHNISIMRSLSLGIGDLITVYKANMIIPQIAENLTKSNNVNIPKICPVCGGHTEIRSTNDVQSLYCTNPDCTAKKIKSFTLFASRDAMNIEGLSEATLEKFIAKGFVHSFTDLFHLDDYREEITKMEGFGEKSLQNLLDSVDHARKTTLPKVIYSLGIANVGLANAKVLCKYFQYDIEKIRKADVETMCLIEGVGEVIATNVYDYMHDEENMLELNKLFAEIQIDIPKVEENQLTLSGLSFVITGSLVHYASRDLLKEEIEEKGGKVTGSVTSKTHCLINNDIQSTSSKNKKAKDLGIPIITEDDFIAKYLE